MQISSTLHAQKHSQPRINQFLDLTGTVSTKQGALAGSYVRNWRIGAKRNLEIGLGARLTSYAGNKNAFITAPAKLARSFTSPFAVVFAGQETQNWDTLIVNKPFTSSLNITANFGYRFSQNWYAGFNIDLFGITIRKKGNSTLYSNGQTRNEPNARPTRYNLLLTGDNDYGTLNSEFFINYSVAERWSIKGVYQFLFVEYKTETIKQTAPDGSIVDRFRNKVNALGIGVTYQLGNHHP